MINLLLLALAVEAITEIIVNSFLFAKFRAKFGRNEYLNEFVNCGYCVSVWVSMFMALIWQCCISGHILLNYIVTVFVLHRISNFIHEVLSRVFHRLPFMVSVHRTESVIINNGDNNE